MKPTKSGMTRKLDKIVSHIVRARGYCVWCGKALDNQLQACHIYSRKNRSVRWYRNNILCMCASCHFKAHQCPTEFTEFVKKFLGDLKYQELKERANSIKKWTLEEMVELYEAFERIEKGL